MPIWFHLEWWQTGREWLTSCACSIKTNPPYLAKHRNTPIKHLPQLSPCRFLPDLLWRCSCTGWSALSSNGLQWWPFCQWRSGPSLLGSPAFIALFHSVLDLNLLQNTNGMGLSTQCFCLFFGLFVLSVVPQQKSKEISEREARWRVAVTSMLIFSASCVFCASSSLLFLFLERW